MHVSRSRGRHEGPQQQRFRAQRLRQAALHRRPSPEQRLRSRHRTAALQSPVPATATASGALSPRLGRLVGHTPRPGVDAAVGPRRPVSVAGTDRGGDDLDLLAVPPGTHLGDDLSGPLALFLAGGLRL